MSAAGALAIEVAPARILSPQRQGLANGPTGFGSSLWHVEDDTRWVEHVHDDHELLHVLSGSFLLEAGNVSWLVPPTVGVWIPAGVAHRSAATRGTRFYCQYVDPARCSIAWQGITSLTISPLVAELVAHLHRVDLPVDERRRAEHVMFDQLRPIDRAGIQLPMPSDERALELAHALLADPADQRSLDQWGHQVGASPRTLTRVFAAETGMNFADWRAQVRVRAALVHLTNGMSVTRTARALGYRSASSFVASFRRTTGRTPLECVASGVIADRGDAVG
jgi:methylphosphotriester-DNA--protein-cysteine methyltransferase/quercetin dioxygenase-like cupin family protein